MVTEQQAHEYAVWQAQFLLDQVISFFKDDPFLTNSEKLSLLQEMRSALDDAEHNLRSAPDCLFHTDGHDERMAALKHEMEAKRVVQM